jgi:multidrug efflux pump subunit AcrA (membrane-fusion protein)
VDIGRVRVGREASFTVDTFPEKEFRGRVKAIYPKAVLQDNVVNYLAIVAFSNPGGRLRPGMTANVKIETSEETTASSAGGEMQGGSMR